MILKELLSVIEPIEVVGRTDIEIKGLHFDSRQIGEGDLFVAQVGTAVERRGSGRIVGQAVLARQWTMDKGQWTKYLLYPCREHGQGAGVDGEQMVR